MVYSLCEVALGPEHGERYNLSGGNSKKVNETVSVQVSCIIEMGNIILLVPS